MTHEDLRPCRISNPARIRIVLAEKALDAQIEFVSVDLIGAGHKQAAFLARNPSGVLPILELDDGTNISESTAITEYLDGNPTLTGRTPREKAMIHMMQRRAEADLLDAIGNYFHNATPGLGPVLQVYKNPERIDRTAWGLQQRDKALSGIKYFDDVLKGRSYAAGDEFSTADITVFAGLMFADAAAIATPEDCTALSAWRSRVADLPSVRNRSGQIFEPEDLRRLGFRSVAAKQRSMQLRAMPTAARTLQDGT